MSGTNSKQLVCVVYGVYEDDTINNKDIINEGGCYVIGNHSTQTVTINVGQWTRGLIFSYLPFTVTTR